MGISPFSCQGLIAVGVKAVLAGSGCSCGVNEAGMLLFRFRQNAILSKRIKLIWAVQSRLQKHLAFAVGQIKSTTRAVLLRTRGVAQRHETWGRMRWTRTCCGRTASDADGEVVWS